MNANDWPEGLFYIRPSLSPDWGLLVAIGTKDQGNWIGGAKLDKNDPFQQWQADAVTKGDRTSAVIRNQGKLEGKFGLVLAASSTDQNYVVPQLFNLGNEHQTWKIDQYPGRGLRRIQCRGYSENTWMHGNPNPRAPSSPLMLLGGYDSGWGDFELVPVSEAS